MKSKKCPDNLPRIFFLTIFAIQNIIAIQNTPVESCNGCTCWLKMPVSPASRPKLSLMDKNDKTASLEHRQELRYRILRTAMPMFKEKGIKAVRMDDIAQTLAMSKRTLYEIYADKEELLLECIKLDSDEFVKRLQDYALSAENDLDVVVTFFRLKFADLDSLNPQFLADLKKYDNVMSFFRQRREEQRQSSVELITRCIENGYFVEGIDYSAIEDINDEIVDSGIFFRLLDRHSMRGIFRNFFIVMLRGICTEKGLVMLDTYFRKSPL